MPGGAGDGRIRSRAARSDTTVPSGMLQDAGAVPEAMLRLCRSEFLKIVLAIAILVGILDHLPNFIVVEELGERIHDNPGNDPRG